MSLQVSTIRLYGPLGAKFGRVHVMAVTSAAEAVRALSSQIPGFERFLTNAKQKGMEFAVFYGKNNLTKDELGANNGSKEIRIAPIMMGSKKAGVFQTILGIVMIVAAVIAAPATGGSSLVAAFAQGGFWGSVAMMGAAMVMGGVAQMLTPMPKGMSSKDGPENTPNPHFNGPVNTTAQGSCVPVLHGRLIVGSKVISAGIEIEDHSYVPIVGGDGDGGSDVKTRYPLQEPM